jgi:AraC family transcriptional regulator of adaptative response / DNA-3-methyladenine glycosylase II
MEALAAMDPASLAFPRSRQVAIAGLVTALATGSLDLGPDADRVLARAQLSALPGLGPWTVETIAMRALGDPDAFLPTDLGIRLAASVLGLPTTPGALRVHAERWRPWRSYAVLYLWSTGDHAINRLPSADVV